MYVYNTYIYASVYKVDYRVGAAPENKKILYYTYICKMYTLADI